MKRFYTAAHVESGPDGHAILLDGRPVKTPARLSLAVPSEKLADAIRTEWDAQGEKIDPATMPMTGFANAALDRVLPALGAFRAQIGTYAQSDLLCYRAADPPLLVAQQAGLWQPLLDWASQRFDVSFVITSGMMPVDQPSLTIARLCAAVDALDPWLLPGVANMVQISGSLIGTLARLHGGCDGDGLWAAADLDDAWQAAHWGEDEEAQRYRSARHADFLAADRYCGLVMAD